VSIRFQDLVLTPPLPLLLLALPLALPLLPLVLAA
jgi:hypothetical protein